MKSFQNTILLIVIMLISTIALSQSVSKNECIKFLTDGYISDGQEHIAKLAENNVAKFYCTFYGGSYYRIIACSDINQYPLKLTVYDSEKNLLFCNKDYDYTPYWNFIFSSTVDCIIEIEFDVEKWLKQEVKLLIGFKEK
ncbi:MAG: hypothetical protein MI739_01650 [Bacteroidales bacterium]|nr:hypothetical protein [Bacteroidales bacterium]